MIASNRILAALLFISALLGSCAIRKGPPEGGPRDDTPPKVVSEKPISRTLNFAERRIVITFDEYIELSNAFQEVQVTPTPAKAPSLTLSKRSLYIDTAGMQLQPNTTYTIQFGNAIKDINEGNVLQGYKYIFSTGSYIDSLFIEGSLAPADPMQNLEKVRLQLYAEGNDTGLFKGRPAYTAMAEEGGHFKIDNLPKGTFRLFALEDKNNNYVLDPGERVGFVSDLVALDTSANTGEIVLASPVPDQLRFTGLSSSTARLSLKANMPLDSIRITSADQEIPGYQFWNEKRDSLIYWFANGLTAESSVSIQAFSGTYGADTMTRAVADLKDTGRIMYLVVDQLPDNPVKFGSQLILRFTEPVDTIDHRRIYLLMEDSTDLPGLRFRFTDSSRMTMAAVYPFEENAKYRALFGKGAFTSIRGRTQDSTSTMFSAPSRRDFGLLEINISTAEDSFIFELLNSTGAVLYTRPVSGSETITLPYVQPGAYKLRLIHDRNRNGRWDTGDLRKGIQPEPIYYHTQEITARANWELAGIIFDISQVVRP